MPRPILGRWTAGLRGPLKSGLRAAQSSESSVPQSRRPRALRSGWRGRGRLYGSRRALPQPRVGRVSARRSFGRHVLPGRYAAAAAGSRRELWLRSEAARLQLPRADLPARPPPPSPRLPPPPPPPPGSRSPGTLHPTPLHASFLSAGASRVPALHSPCYLPPGHSHGGAHCPLLHPPRASPACTGGTAALGTRQRPRGGEGRTCADEREGASGRGGWQFPFNSFPPSLQARFGGTGPEAAFIPTLGHRNTARGYPEPI
ncbi:uncharacterized protein [Bos indicus]|uniref:Basic proline-rich protein-like n=1 Tax=Bos indicus TaxID=9915 RepID=A0ABM4SR38_BOSIN